MNQNKKNNETEQKELNDWKSFAGDLNDLLQIEAAGIMDEYEKQKKHLMVWLETVNDWLRNVEDLTEEKENKIKSSVEKLHIKAATGKADTEDALKEQQRTISNGIGQKKINRDMQIKPTEESSFLGKEEIHS